MVCKGICERVEYFCSQKDGYRAGNQRCQVCDRFVRMAGLWCVCCGYRLRSKPRKSSFKDAWRARNGMPALPVSETNRKEIVTNPDGTISAVEVVE